MKNRTKKCLLTLCVTPFTLLWVTTGLAQGLEPSDPVTSEATELLDESGVLARQSEMGEGIILLEHQLRHAQAIERLIDILGPDAMIEVAPGQFRNFADTPAGIRAQIELDKLKKEYDRLNEPPAPQMAPRQPRSEVTSSEIEEIISRRISEMDLDKTPASAETEIEIPSIYLQEIFGKNNELRAILQVGKNFFRVQSGDILGRGIRVISVENDGVKIDRFGQEIFLSIPG